MLKPIVEVKTDPITDALIEANRKQFKKAFRQHGPSRDGHIQVKEFLTLCSNVKLVPDVTSLMAVKQLLKQLRLATCLGYSDFENLLTLIANHSFQTNEPLVEKLKMLLVHIRNPCKLHYNVNLSLQPRRALPKSKEENVPAESKLSSHASFREKSYKVLAAARKPQAPRPAAEHPSTPHFNLKQHLAFTTLGVPRDSLHSASRRRRLSNGYSLEASKVGTPERGGCSRVSTPDRGLSVSMIGNSSDLVRVFSKFRMNHDLLHSQRPAVPSASNLIVKHHQHIHNLRKVMFEKRFVLSLLFNAWKALHRSSTVIKQ